MNQCEINLAFLRFMVKNQLDLRRLIFSQSYQESPKILKKLFYLIHFLNKRKKHNHCVSSVSLFSQF